MTRKDSIPTTAVYTYNGKRQPAAFASGVAAAMDLISAVSDLYDDEPAAIRRMHSGMLEFVAKDGLFAEGALATIAEHVTWTVNGGPPILGNWEPCRQRWRGANSEIPPQDCMFFDVEGVPYSVEPNLHCLQWFSAGSSTCAKVDDIRGRAKRISRTQFYRLRHRVGIDSKREAA